MLLIVLLVLQLKAQLVYDEWGNILPFSLAERYKDEIEKFDVPSFVIPIMNNDSLCRKYNKGRTFEELEESYIGGIDLRIEPISLKKNGICIKLKNGKLWRYAIEGKSAGGIGFDFGFPKLLTGTYIAVFAPDTTYLIQPPKIYHSENLLERHKKRGLRGSVDGKKLIMEYYEPNTLKEEEDIIIKRISYHFVAFGNRNPSSFKTPELKSGFYGSSAYSSCQKDVVCTDIGSYQNEAKSVVFLRAEFEIDEDDNGYPETHFRIGTGFFLNKAGGYGDNDSPILATAGHFYSFYKLGLTSVDIISYIQEFSVITKYQNKVCGIDDTENRGIVLPSLFNRIALGSSYDKEGLPSYSANKDYAILQAGSSIKQLSYYDLVYGAWSKNHDYNSSSNVGYFCIHHPKGDVKKINKDNHRTSLVTFDGFQLKYDLGLTESGSSGAPVFNSSRQIVGFHVASTGDKACNLLGQMISTNGKFDNLYNDCYSTLDPSEIGSASSSNPSPPLPSELPPHCRNCVQDVDETGIDCGGSCYPCGMQDVINLKTLKDIPGPVKSRYDLIADPDPNTTLVLKSGNYSFEAGMNIFLNGGFEVAKGAVFYASIDNELMSEADRGCQSSCVTASMPYFTPNGDGYLDFFYIRQAFVASYDIVVANNWGQIVYSAYNIPVFTNGYINAWDGTGGSNGPKTIYITARDCNGNSSQFTFYTTLSIPTKSATTSSDNADEEINDIKTGEAKIKVYPNPLFNKVSIDYSGNEFPVKYKLTEMNGKLIIEGETDSQTEILNLNGFASGAYIINVKAGECNLVQKLIKE